MHLDQQQLDTLHALYDEGKLLQAYEQGRAIAPLEEWEGPIARVLAGRLAGHLGGQTRGYWFIRQAYRQHPESFVARYYHAYRVWRARGPYYAWRWMTAFGEVPAGIDNDFRSSWYAMLGEVAGVLRDFDVAERWMDRASEVAPHSPWVKLCRAQLYEFEDRYDEALASAEESLVLRPWYRPGVQAVAHLLTLMARDKESLALLKEATGRIESSAIAAQLYATLSEEQRHEEAAEALELFARYSPLAEKPVRQWLAAQRSDIAYFRGDLAEAARLARESDSEFYKELAANMSHPEAAQRKRVVLPIGFVRQHRVTCAPATLATITNFWSMSSDHLQVAEEICYNGTSAYSERKWAWEHDWHAREFTVTAASAAALIDAGIPFTFTTVEPGSAHLQAVIGYDAKRGTLLFRDPFWRNQGEGLTDKVLEHYRAYGPRGMALVPLAERARLDAIDLPDTAIWDQLHELDDALENHCRDDAQALLDKLVAASPDHFLTLDARRRLAMYDGNVAARLTIVEQQLARCPDNAALQLERLHFLRDQVRRDERLKIYAEQCAKKDSHPIFWQHYAEELRADARRQTETHFLLRRSVTRWSTEPNGYYSLAGLYWDQRRFEEALELYRFAACLGDKEEHTAQSYFSAAGHFKRSEEVLAFLRDRFARFGKKNGAPARTLVSALLHRDRYAEAQQTLEEALALRPEDGQLLLYAADVYLSLSMEHAAQAQACLDRARPRVPKAEWLRSAARMASIEGRLADALTLWREVAELQPLSVEAHGHVARLLAMTAGQNVALAHLEAVANRFPHHYPLHQQWLEWLRDEPLEVYEPAIRRVLEVNPDDAWIHRELAVVLSNTRRHEEARAAAQHALALDPNSSSSQLAVALVERNADRRDIARAAVRRALELGIDNDYAMAQLVDLCGTRAERREAVEFLRAELVKQVIFGDALLSFRDVGRSVYEPDELAAVLREAHAARPDLWHAWSALAQHLTEMDQLDEAQRLIVEATERFPLMPRLWLDRAALARMQGDAEGELEALWTAYRINPAFSTGVRELCDALERQGDYPQARQILENAAGRNSLDFELVGLLAESLWRAGEREAATDRVQKIVEQDPGIQRAWRMLDYYCGELGTPERSIAVARRLTEQRPGEARSWMMLAQLLDGSEMLAERLAALDRAVEFNPKLSDAHDLRAVILAGEQRWDEALAACAPAAWNGDTPVELKGRAAWIVALRGETAEAIERYRAVLAEEPHYTWAWKNLAELCLNERDFPAYLEAAEGLVRVSPLAEISYGYLAEARQLTGDRAGAKEAFEKAFEITPQYEFAGNALFDMQLEDGELDAGAETLRRVRQHSETPFVLARQAQLDAARGDLPAATEMLGRLALTTAENAWPIRASFEAVGDRGGFRDAERALWGVLGNDAVQEEAAVCWAIAAMQLEDAEVVAGRLSHLVQRPAVFDAAVQGAMEWIGKNGTPPMLHRFVYGQRAALSTSMHAWGQIAYGCSCVRDYAFLRDWTRDWRQRPEAQPWMLVNVVESMWAAGDAEEARQCSRHALTLEGFGRHLHHLWLAADAALAGRVAEADERLAEAQTGRLDEDYAFLAALVETLLRSEKNQGSYQELVNALLEARVGYAPFAKEPGRRDVYWKALWQIVKRRGGPQHWVWYWWGWLTRSE